MVFIPAILSVIALALSLDAESPARGWKPTAIPLLNFSSDHGTGYGLRFNLFHYDGSTVPYNRAYSFQVFATTRGKQVHRIRLDAPRLKPGQRLEVEAVFEKEDFANYFGDLDADALRAYSKEEKTYQQTNPRLQLTWIRTLRPPFRGRAELRLSHRGIVPNAPGTGLLDRLRPLGAEGGFLARAVAALRCDTRDDYTNSSRGVLEEVQMEYSWGGKGDYAGARLGLQHRHFIGILPGVVLAHRVQADLTWGDFPFYEQLSLGGSETIRGLSAARRRGEGRLLGNGELRWRGVRVSRSQRIYTGLVLFGDVGQTFKRGSGPGLRRWERGLGAGLRFHWHSTIVRADYGSSGERTGLYMTFSQVF